MLEIERKRKAYLKQRKVVEKVGMNYKLSDEVHLYIRPKEEYSEDGITINNGGMTVFLADVEAAALAHILNELYFGEEKC